MSPICIDICESRQICGIIFRIERVHVSTKTENIWSFHKNNANFVLVHVSTILIVDMHLENVNATKTYGLCQLKHVHVEYVFFTAHHNDVLAPT